MTEQTDWFGKVTKMTEHTVYLGQIRFTEMIEQIGGQNNHHKRIAYRKICRLAGKATTTGGLINSESRKI